MSSTEQTAYYQNNILKLEIFRISWTDGESYLEIYDKDTMVFKSIDTSALLLFPHPLKRDKLIAVLANKAPIKVKAFKVLIRSGSGRNKRYLLNVIPDSTSKFYYKPGNYFVSINKDQLRKLEKGKDDFFMELYSPLSRLGQIQYCDYESYYTATSIYTIPKYDIIDTVLSYKRGWIPALACKRYIKINSSGFINNKSRHFVKKLIKSGKLNCPSFEERSRFGYITEEEKTKTYEDLFRDDFILYLNKNKLLTP